MRPVLVESKNPTTLIKENITNKLKLSSLNNPLRWKNQQLILISLDPKEKIEVNDTYYRDGLKSLDICEDLEHSELLNNDKYCYKVIATQEQISPDYIQQFIEEFNKDNVKDIEIEMLKLGFNIAAEFPYHSSLPKLTNGFITIINKEPILYTEKEVKRMCSKAFLIKCDNNDIIQVFDKWFNRNKKK